MTPYYDDGRLPTAPGAPEEGAGGMTDTDERRRLSTIAFNRLLSLMVQAYGDDFSGAPQFLAAALRYAANLSLGIETFKLPAEDNTAREAEILKLAAARPAPETREPEADSLVAALRAIIDMEPEPYAFPDDWQAQIAACWECKRWKNHPIQQGICDTHRQPFRDRVAHDKAEQLRLHWRMRSIAREALDAHVLAVSRMRR